jgi:hypothetical protein
VGWRVGKITSRHTKKLVRFKTHKGYEKLVVYYDSDKTEAQNTLCFGTDNDDEVANSPVST